MKLLGKICYNILGTVGWCVIIAGSVVPAFFVGAFAIAVIGFFSHRLTDILQNSPISIAAVGYLVWVVGGLGYICWWRISDALMRKRAIKAEIKPVSEIQIVEPTPPGRPEGSLVTLVISLCLLLPVRTRRVVDRSRPAQTSGRYRNRRVPSPMPIVLAFFQPLLL
jgi:hypothetical protein